MNEPEKLRSAILEKLSKVIDPATGADVVRMDLIEDLAVDVSGRVTYKEYLGELWVEVMLVRGLNDTEEALHEIAVVLERIRPDEVHINLPTRPPAETWVQPPDEEGLMRALAILGDVAQVVHPAEGNFDLSGSENVVDAIVSIITRHPMQEDELRRALEKWMPGLVDAALEQLASSGQAQAVERYGMRFWSASPAHYPQRNTPS